MDLSYKIVSFVETQKKCYIFKLGDFNTKRKVYWGMIYRLILNLAGYPIFGYLPLEFTIWCNPA